MPGELGALKHGIRIAQRSLVRRDLVLDLFLTVLQTPDLPGSLAELVLERKDLIIRLLLFTADLGEFFFNFGQPVTLLGLEGLQTGKSGPDVGTAVHFLQDTLPFYLKLLTETADIFRRRLQSLLCGLIIRPDP